MREIKFRAWLPKGYFADKELCKMDNRVCVSYDGKLMELEGGWDYQGDSDLAILMQYTGLKDKNGTEIYEGDIVLTPYGRYKWNANEEEDESKVLDMIPSRVIQSTMGWALVPEMGKKKAGQRIKKRHYMFPTHYSESEVIGNIYENGELLK